jgi:hypothetical protein
MPTDATARGRIPAKLLNAKRAAVSRFLSSAEALPSFAAFAISTKPQHNVVGVGIGYKISGGKLTNRRAIRIYVDRKLPPDVVPQQFMLPEKIDGIEADVVETGRFRALAVVPRAQRRLRPAKPGSSVGFRFSGAMAGYVMAGTFGAEVQANGTRYLLSNNHVLANENALPVGSPIFQPGLLDHGDPNHDQIARLTRFIPIAAGQPNTVDCAIAEILDPKTVSATFLPRVGRLASPDPIDALEGMHVEKTGRTTGFTTGSVMDVSADITVGYDVGNVTFQDQILIVGDRKPFSGPGDSGSVIVDRATRRATALLFAGSDTHTIANHLSDVLARLGVSLVI